MVNVVMLKVVNKLFKLSVNMLSIVMLSVIVLRVVMLSVVAPIIVHAKNSLLSTFKNLLASPLTLQLNKLGPILQFPFLQFTNVCKNLVCLSQAGLSCLI